MLKRFILILALAGLLSPAFGAGTIPFSLSQQFDSLGKPLAGCKLYTIQAGTTNTPQNAYQDSALTIALSNPQTCDAAGRLPQMFLADGTVKVRLTDKNGVSVVVADNIQVVGASSGGGGGGTVDPTTILATGDIKYVYGTGVLGGFVRCNNRTIGSATSGATERANADTQALFVFLYGQDTSLPVSGGRGASAAIDFAANKTIQLPDCRSRVIAGLGDMGNVDSLRLTATYFGATPTVLGAASTFLESRALGTGNLPPYTPGGTVPLSVNSASTVTKDGFIDTINSPGAGTPVLFSRATGATQGTLNSTGTGTLSGTPQGGTSTPFSVVQPTLLMTVYIKL